MLIEYLEEVSQIPCRRRANPDVNKAIKPTPYLNITKNRDKTLMYIITGELF